MANKLPIKILIIVKKWGNISSKPMVWLLNINENSTTAKETTLFIITAFSVAKLKKPTKIGSLNSAPPSPINPPKHQPLHHL